MTKTKIVETTEKYDENGKLVEKITREETTEDNRVYYPQYTVPVTTTTPNVIRSYDPGKPWDSSWSVTSNMQKKEDE